MIILSKLCKSVVLRLSSNKLYLIALNESNNNQISVWSVLDQKSFFEDYDMNGETESNEIFFSLPIGTYEISILSISTSICDFLCSFKILLLDLLIIYIILFRFINSLIIYISFINKYYKITHDNLKKVLVK